jgi:predicted aspartyl protease
MNFKHEFSVGPQMLVAMIMASLVLLSCGGDSPGTLLPPTAGNVVPIVIDAGPVPTMASEINVAYVSVTVCTSGTLGTATCQTIDHVLVDTGSSGLRLLNSALYSNLNLPAVTNSSGAIGECMTFADGFTWGSVRSADIYLGGEVAPSVPIQVIGDQPGGATAVPTDCSSTGGINENIPTLLGANGILGVGLFTNDCDICLTQPISAAYYTCTATGCTNSTVTSAQVVQNPVALFLQDNNGVLIDLPAVSAAGASILNGSLIFGIGTQSNNQLGSATVYATDQYGNFITNFNGANTSYIDSGSNALFFYDSNIPICPVTTWAYCPPSPTFLKSLSATNSAATTGTSSGMVNFSIVNADHLDVSIVAANIGGTSTPGQFDWGLPFFFGRKVFTAISGMGTPGPSGPYFAY